MFSVRNISIISMLFAIAVLVGDHFYTVYLNQFVPPTECISFCTDALITPSKTVFTDAYNQLITINYVSIGILCAVLLLYIISTTTKVLNPVSTFLRSWVGLNFPQILHIASPWVILILLSISSNQILGFISQLTVLNRVPGDTKNYAFLFAMIIVTFISMISSVVDIGSLQVHGLRDMVAQSKNV